jgi:hypothetical protein
MVLAVPFEYPFVVVTSWQLRRIEGGWGMLSMIQLTTGVVAPIGFFFRWQYCRPQRIDRMLTPPTSCRL